MNYDLLVDLALAEDAGLGDLTSESIFPPDATAEGEIVAREALVLCGVHVAARVFNRSDPDVSVEPLEKDGARLQAGDAAIRVSGPVRGILTAERTALNFLQFLSGIATLARSYADAAAPYGVRVCDTRKTLPGFRALSKYAVRCGGCFNHRSSLADHVLIKDNHIAAAGDIANAVRRARAYAPHTAKIEVEADSLEMVSEAVAAGADIILLDNMTPDRITAAKELVGGRAVLEASGGITLENLGPYAQTGIDVISVGALTHSNRAADLSLDLDGQI
jgi:nicotinate-nucleotide pyrophosphorylase (carboxylating)